MLKNRSHMNFQPTSIDSNGLLLVCSFGAGAGLIVLTIMILLFYMSSKASRKQLNLMVFCILLTRLLIGILAIMRFFSLAITNELGYGSFSFAQDGCRAEAGIEYTAITFHFSLVIVWLREIEDASKNPMISAIRSRYFNVIAGFAFSIGFCLIVYLSFSTLERELLLNCTLEGPFMLLSGIPFMLYISYIIYLYWISKRHKALQPLMEKNEYYREIYNIVKYYNMALVLYNVVFWILTTILLKSEARFNSVKMETLPGKILSIWASFAILIEFIPLFAQIRFLKNSSKIKQGLSEVKDYVVTDVIFDSFREMIVKYLIKGINNAMLKHPGSGSQNLIPSLGSAINRIRSNELPEVDETDVLKDSLEEEVYRFSLKNSNEEEKLSSKEFMLDDVNNLTKFVEMTVIAPNLFRKFRKYYGIDDFAIGNTFSIDKLGTEQLQIKLGSGKGGSFFIFPSNTRFLLKAIKGTEMSILKQILVDYFCHMVRCGRSFLNPILGLFTINIKGEKMIEPLHFMLMPNVMPYQWSLLSDQMKILQFDLKGSLGQRQQASLPENLLNIEGLSSKLLDDTYKDIDFLKSFRSLELKRREALPILNQLQSDTQLLARMKLFDYSIMLFLASLPLFQPRDVTSSKARRFLSETMNFEERPVIIEKKINGRESVSLIQLKIIGAKVNLKFSSNLWTLLYHIRDPEDVEMIKNFVRYSIINKGKHKGPDVVNQKSSFSKKETKVILEFLLVKTTVGTFVFFQK